MVEDNFVKIKSHLIITDIHNEFDINWSGKIAETAPMLVNGLPIFVIIGSRGRVEMNTINMRQLEDCAKKLTDPKGKTAITKDSSHIYIKEVNGNEALLCTVTCKKVTSYAPMYDKVGWR